MSIRPDSAAFAKPKDADARGLSQRDYIAIAAMQGMLSGEGIMNAMTVAARAYEMADAMIEESQKRGEHSS